MTVVADTPNIPHRTIHESAVSRLILPAPMPCVAVARWIYECPVCHERFDDKAEAEACAATGTTPEPVTIGTVVLCGREKFGWFDGDPDWVAEKRPPNPRSRDHFEWVTRYGFFYVVVRLERASWARHEWRVVLCTRAMRTSYREEVASPEALHIVAPTSVPESVRRAIPDVVAEARTKEDRAFVNETPIAAGMREAAERTER